MKEMSDTTKPIYLDYNSTTPVDPRVVDAMLPYFTENFGNPSSVSHAYGWDADMAISLARRSVARLLGAKAKDILFTSGATESNNIVLQGKLLPLLRQGQKPHLITSMVEHKCVLDTAKALEKWGAEVTYLQTDKVGRIHVKDIEKALQPNTVLVSLIFGNNEIGTLNPIAEIGTFLRSRNIAFHTDAAQVAGKIPMAVADLKAQFISGSAQKMYGPKGVGFLYIENGHELSDLEPIFFGGSQERGLRPGTLNVPGIVGLGKACEIALQGLAEEEPRLRKLQQDFIRRVRELDDSILLNGCSEKRLPTNISLTFPHLAADIFSLGLNGLACSSGSACSMGEASYVLKALGHTPEIAKKTVRLGIGRFTTEEHLEAAFQKIRDLIIKNQEISNT